MTKEELQTLLESDESFKSSLKELGFESAADVDGLKRKRDELLGKNKALSEQFKELKSQMDELDLEGYKNYKEEGIKKPNIERELAEMKKQIEKANNDKIKIESAYNQSLIRDSLHKAFRDANIDSAHYDILTSAFTGKARVEVDGDARNIIIDDGGLGSDPSEYFKAWASEQGKSYVAKPVNTGAGAQKLGAGSSTMRRAEFDALSPMQQSEAVKSIQIID